MGVSLKRFRGWEPTTVYEHDDAGRLVGSAPETEWDTLQRGWMLALAEYRASRCRRCGNNINETTAKEGTHQWRVRKVRCFACDALEGAQQQASNKPEDRPGARLMWVEKKARAGAP